MDSINSGWIDITRPTYAGMTHWPGDPDVECDRISDMQKGDPCNVSRLVMGSHTGTHIDAPLHYISGGASAEAAPLDVMMGRVTIVEIDDPVSIRRHALDWLEIEKGARLLFRTRNSNHPWEAPFAMDFVYIAADAAKYLAERGAVLVGIDGMSVGGFYQDMVETHRALLGAGIWIIENLDLRMVQPGVYDMICLPMKLTGADGAPARVLIRPV